VASGNVELVRSIFEDWKHGDFHAVDWADPDIELTRPDALVGGELKGLASTAEGWREWLSEWEGLRAEADEFRELDAERVLVFGRMCGRGRLSGAVVDTEIVNLFHIRNNKVTRLVLYSSRERASADLGLIQHARSPDV
jgi:SnoaL-like domain